MDALSAATLKEKCMHVVFTIFCFLLTGAVCSAADLRDVVDAAKSGAGSYYIDKTAIPTEQKLKNSPQGTAAAESYKIVNSPEFQRKVDEYAEKLKSGVFSSAGKAVGESYYKDLRLNLVGGAKGFLAPDERIYVLISSSVPIETLRAYAADIDALGDSNVRMVLRGFVGGGQKITPTINFLASIINKDHQACVGIGGAACDSYEATADIDPNIFRRYQPEVVPAIVFVKGVSPNMPDASEGLDDIVGPLDDSKVMMIYGDPSLGYALETFAREGGGEKLQKAAEKIQR